MGRCSFLLVGTKKAMEETFGSVCHGAGRLMSRTKAAHQFRADKLVTELAEKGVVVYGASKRGLSEEAPEAYKDVREVVNVVEGAGLAKKVAKLRPLGAIKG
jgi:tRNA-splicing ligase RtcB